MKNSRRPWDLPERMATPEKLVFNRRAVLVGGASALALMSGPAIAQRAGDVGKAADPSAGLYPAKRNETYKLNRAITDEKINTHYNNFYEYGTSKDVAAASEKLQVRPWAVKIDGMVEKPIEIDVDDLMRKMTLEERTYRHRCVEAWSMGLPGRGFRSRSSSISRVRSALRNM